MDYFGDFETWLHDVAEEKTFEISIIRKIWTPEEMENKYTDEDEYKLFTEYADLVEVIPLGGTLNKAKDYLLGFKVKWIHTEVVDHEYKSEVCYNDDIVYFKLSDIILTDNTVHWKEELKESCIE